MVSADDVGNTALWLASDLGSAVTGEVVHVDAGYNIMGYTDVEALMGQLE
jgi:enoyl-[acyl-carrier protein] reductase I